MAFAQSLMRAVKDTGYSFRTVSYPGGRTRQLSTRPPPSLRRWTQQLVIELADRLDRLLQLLIIAQPAAHLSNPLAAHTDLTRPSSRVGHRQDKYVMPFAARAFRASLGMPDRAL
jgi:hypothetical protein